MTQPLNAPEDLLGKPFAFVVASQVACWGLGVSYSSVEDGGATVELQNAALLTMHGQIE